MSNRNLFPPQTMPLIQLTEDLCNTDYADMLQSVGVMGLTFPTGV